MKTAKTTSATVPDDGDDQPKKDCMAQDASNQESDPVPSVLRNIDNPPCETAFQSGENTSAEKTKTYLQSPMEPQTADILMDRTRIPDGEKFHGLTPIKDCGKGGYGRVYYCQDISENKIALKILSKIELGKYWERELNGIKNYRKIAKKAPELLQIYHVEDDEDVLYYTMEAADSVSEQDYSPDTLASRLEHGPLPQDKMFDILFAVFSQIKILHENGMAHRDIKPDNILFVNGKPKLGDIGLMADLSKTISNSILGTPAFWPPEALSCDTFDEEILRQWDLYAFGGVIFCAITGRTTPKKKWLEYQKSIKPSQLIIDLNALLGKLCAKDPKKRIQSIEMIEKVFSIIEAREKIISRIKERTIIDDEMENDVSKFKELEKDLKKILGKDSDEANEMEAVPSEEGALKTASTTTKKPKDDATPPQSKNDDSLTLSAKDVQTKESIPSSLPPVDNGSGCPPPVDDGNGTQSGAPDESNGIKHTKIKYRKWFCCSSFVAVFEAIVFLFFMIRRGDNNVKAPPHLPEVSKVEIQTNSDDPLLSEKVKKFDEAVRLYQAGGTRKAKGDAIDQFESLAKDNYAPAQYMLGYCYENDPNYKDIKKAFEYYRKAADNRNPDAQYALGRCYHEGVGVENNKKDDAEAFFWWRTAAEFGNHAQAQFKVGEFYKQGVHGLAQNPKNAAEWFEKAANQGDSNAQYWLGRCYELGEGVSAPNIVKAVKWYYDAAENTKVSDEIKHNARERLVSRSKSQIPNIGLSKWKGLSFVCQDGSLAARAGLKTGDTIIRIDSREVKDSIDYCYLLLDYVSGGESLVPKKKAMFVVKRKVKDNEKEKEIEIEKEVILKE